MSTRIICGSLVALAAVGAWAQRPYYLLPGVHPGYTVTSMRPSSMATSGANAAPNTGGMAWLPDGRLFIVSMNSTNGGAEANRRGISNGYIFSGIPTATSNATVTVDSVSTGYQMPSGAVVVGDTIYTLDNENGITRLTKNGNAWTKTNIYNGALGRTPGVLSDTVNRTWTGGMVYRDGYLYAAVGMGLIPGGTSYGFTTAQSQRLYRGKGAIWKVSLSGAVADTFAGGVRNPVSMGWGPDSQMFYTDNQGSFMPACGLFPVRQGAFFGHEKTPFDNQFRTPPAIIFPYGSNPGGGDSNNPTLARVATDMLTLRSGMYKNQMLVGTNHSTGINRVFLEKIPDGAGGYIFQGAVMPFSQGFGVGTGTGSINAPTGSLPGVLPDFRTNVNRMSYGPDGRIYLGGGNTPGSNSQGAHGFQDGLQYGLARLVPNGDTAFEIKAVRSLNSTQLEVEFTLPIQTVTPSNFWIRQWGDLQGGSGDNNSYGAGYQSETANLTVSAVSLTNNNTRAVLTISGLKQRPTVTTQGSVEDRTWGYVVQIRTRGVLAADTTHHMWTDTLATKRGLTAWYTLNKFGPGVDAGSSTAIAHGDTRDHHTGLLVATRADGLVVRAPVDGSAWTLRTLDTRGRVLSTHSVEPGKTEFLVPTSSLAAGVTVLEAKVADGRRFTASASKP